MTKVVYACKICKHPEDVHVPKCADTEPCGGTEAGYCLDCWEIPEFASDLHNFEFDWVFYRPNGILLENPEGIRP